MPATDGQNAWVLRVLGVAVGGAAATPAGPALAPGDLLPLWMEAKKATDTSVEQLQRAIQAINDPDLQQIAEYGLNGATTGQSTKLVAALKEVSGGASPQNRAELESAVQAFRDFLAGSPIVALLEDNPFGITVPLRSKLGSALDEIQRAIVA